MAILFLNDFLADRKANAGAWKFPAGMQALEYLEDLFLILRVNTDAIILNVDIGLALFFPGPNTDHQIVIWMPELRGIGKEVIKKQLPVSGVDPDIVARGKKAHLSFFLKGRYLCDGMLNQVFNGIPASLLSVCGNLGISLQVIDKPLQLLRPLHCKVNKLQLFLVQLVIGTAAQQLHEAGNIAQGRFEVVGVYISKLIELLIGAPEPDVGSFQRLVLLL